ncbi:unnamed protein product, partial [Meganyctiphanes norvegica]
MEKYCSAVGETIQEVVVEQNSVKQEIMSKLAYMESNLEDLTEKIEPEPLGETLVKTSVLLQNDAVENMLMNLTSQIDNLTAELQSVQDNQDKVIINLTNIGSTHCPKEYFMTSGPSRQCFKYFNDVYRTWDQATLKCREEGLVLAEPYDPLPV